MCNVAVPYNIAEFFSGIGSQVKALHNLKFYGATSITCEWDIHAIIAYDLIHNPTGEIPEDIRNMSKEQLLQVLRQYRFSNSGKEPLEYSSLKTYSFQTLQRLYTSIVRNHNSVDISQLAGADMPGTIDILTYSFPCQDLSNVGALHGYKKGIDRNSGSRSSLLWQVGRILQEMREAEKAMPRFLLMENVPTLLSRRHLPNFKAWIADLQELGYLSRYYCLNASAFGLPQNRPRLLMISVLVGDDEQRRLVQKYFDAKNSPEAVIKDYMESGFYRKYTIQEFLRTDYTDRQLFQEACECTPNDTVSRRKIWEENPQIIKEDNQFNDTLEVIRTITTKQDRNPNSGNLYFESRIDGKGKFRYLTPRECLLFMGFTDDDYQTLKEHNLEFHKGDALFARDKVIRMAGNSIPVKLLEGMFYQIWQIDQFLSDFHNRHFTENERNERKRDMIRRIKASLRSAGIQFRSVRNAPEEADLFSRKYRTAIFVYDCFDHGCQCECGKIAVPETNRSLWEDLFNEVRMENESAHRKMTEAGWHVIAVWECAVGKEDKMQNLAAAIRANADRARIPDGVMEIV